jgi:chromosome segregation ATPase
MIKSIEELSNDAAELREAFATVEAVAATLEERITSAASAISNDRAAMKGAVETLEKEMRTLAEAVADFEQRSGAARGELDAAISGVADSIESVTTEFGEAIARAGSEFVETVEALLAVATGVGEARDTYAAAAAQRETDLTAWSAETQALGSAAASRVEDLRESIRVLHTETSALAADMGDHLSEKRSKLETWHDGFLDEAEQSVNELVVRIAEAGASQVKAPLSQHVDRLNAELQANAVDLLKRVLAGVEEGLRSVEAEIVEAAGETEEKRASMGPVREALDAVREPIEAVLETVRNTASVVGFSA